MDWRSAWHVRDYSMGTGKTWKIVYIQLACFAGEPNSDAINS